MGIVVYKGPEDPADLSNQYVVPGDEPGTDHVFDLNVVVEDVPAKVEKVLKGAEGHKFEFGAKAADAVTDQEAAA